MMEQDAASNEPGAGSTSDGAPASAPVNANKALWEKGDFTRLAETMRQSGDELVAWIAPTAGMEVLDLGCGDGTTALPAARRGARVLGVDIASNLVAAGNRRAREAGLADLRFVEGDASALVGIEDARFDLVVSMFGAMFAPRPHDVAAEMVRVCRPGGRIVMGNWIPGDPTLVAGVLRICAAYMPPPPEGFVSPVSWGQEETARERFVAAGIPPERIGCEMATYTFRFSGPPHAFLAVFRDFYGPTMNAFEAARRDGREAELQGELEALFEAENRGDAGSTVISATYLRVTIER